MKRVSVILLTLFMALVPLGSVMADKGGIPNGNAEWGQAVSTVAQEGGMGQYFKNGGEARTKFGDTNGDGKTNGKDLAENKGGLLEWFKSLISDTDSGEEPEEEPEGEPEGE